MNPFHKKLLLTFIAGLSLHTMLLAQTEEKIYYYNGQPVRALKPGERPENNQTKYQAVKNPYAQQAIQEKDTINQTLTIRPFSFVKSKFVLGFEQAVAYRKSISLYAGITAADYSGYYSAYNVLGFDFQGQFRFYVQPDKNGLAGLYVGPYAFYKTIKYNPAYYFVDPTFPDEYNFKYRGNSGGTGVLIGYQLVIKNTAVVDVYAGGGIRFSSDNSDKTNLFTIDNKEYSESGIYPNIGLQVGFSL